MPQVRVNGYQVSVPTFSSPPWPSINVAIPSPETYEIGEQPTVEEPAEPTQPDIDVTIPDPDYTYLDTSDIPSPTQITIPDPPSIVVSDLVVTVPDLNVSVPDDSIDWAYEAYTNALLDQIALEAGQLDSKFDTLWQKWFENNDAIWTKPFDLITEMGYVDIMSVYEGKELKYGRSLYQHGYSALFEAVSQRNARLFIKAKLDIERAKRSQYADQKEVELIYAKEVIQNSIKAYNLAVQIYAAKINAYKAYSEKVKGIIATNELKLKVLAGQIAAERVKGQVNRSIIARYNAEVEVQRAHIELYEAQMTVAEKLSMLEAIEIEIQVEEIKAFVAKTKGIVERARQQVLLADVEVIRAELGEANATHQLLIARLAEANANLNAARYRYNGMVRAIQKRGDVLPESRAAVDVKAGGYTAITDAQLISQAASHSARVATKQAEGDRATATADAAEISADVQGRIGDMYSQMYQTIEQLEGTYKALLVDLKYAMFQTEQEVAAILAEANVTNTFSESIE